MEKFLPLSLFLLVFAGGCAPGDSGGERQNKSVTYACSGGEQIQVAYRFFDDGQSSATLTYRGQQIPMHQQRAASGVLFVADAGQPGYRWHSKGDEGTLSLSDGADEQVRLKNCRDTAAQGAMLWQESAEVAQLFRDAGVRGTFVVYDARDNRYRGHNQERAGARYIPASTFKIPNSLIGLATGAVSGPDEVLPYGGKPQPFKMWEQDMGLREAIRVSNVPVYQELARRIGLERMQTNVNLLDFGNHTIGDTVDNFWLVGPLEISALEQSRFLARLAGTSLPLPGEIQQTVRDMVLLESGDGWSLYGKTGWAGGLNPDIGWWVGWVENKDGVHSFALNIDMPNDEDRNKRLELGKASLRALGIL